MPLLNKYEILTVLISALALVLSLYSAINTYYEKHIKTKVFLRWTRTTSSWAWSEKVQELDVCLLISNMSSRPSTVTNAYVELPDSQFESTWYPVKLTSETNPKTQITQTSYSDCTPLNIPPRTAKQFIIAFNYLPMIDFGQHLDLTFKIDGHMIHKSLPIRSKLDSSKFIIAVSERLK